MSQKTAEQINSVCTNYQALLASDDFLRVINISLKGTDFRQDAILKYFQVLREWNWLTDREKANLKSFLENGNVRKAVVWLLNKFSQSPFPATESLNQSKRYNAFLEELFWENGFDRAVSWISQIAKIDERKEVVSDTLDLSEDIQAQRIALERIDILNKYPDLKWHVQVTNEKIIVNTDAWKITFGFSHNEWKNVFAEAEKPYSKEKIQALMRLFGNNHAHYIDILGMQSNYTEDDKVYYNSYWLSSWLWARYAYAFAFLDYGVNIVYAERTEMHSSFLK